MVVIDTEKKGLQIVFKEWETPLYKKLLTTDIEMNSRKAYEYLLDELFPQTISRASVINSLNYYAEKNVLNFRDATGKGGYHRIYSRNQTLKQFWQDIAKQVNQALEPHI